MRKEIEQIQSLTLNCVKTLNGIYDELDENARTLLEAVAAERQHPLFDKLKETVTTYAEQIDNASLELTKTFNEAARIRGGDIDLNMLKVINDLKPSAAELTEICRDYANNQTMLRLIREYVKNNKIEWVEIPSIMADRVTALDKICKDLKDCSRIAADYESPLRTKQFEHIANNFDTVFGAQLKIIG